MKTKTKKIKVCKSVRLWCKKGTSDKVYEIVAVAADSGYEVAARWGRRGGVMHEQTKWAGATRDTAIGVLDRLTERKLKRGYERV